MPQRPSLAFSGDDLTGAAEPGNALWSPGSATPVMPPASILPDPNVMWLDPGLLMEPGTGFGSAQKQDVLGQALTDASQFLDGGGGGGRGPKGPSDLQKAAGVAEQVGDVLETGGKLFSGDISHGGAGTLPSQLMVPGMTPAQQVGTFMEGTGPEATAVGMEWFGGPQTPADFQTFSRLMGAPEGSLSIPGMEYGGSTDVGAGGASSLATTLPMAGASSLLGMVAGGTPYSTPMSLLPLAMQYLGPYSAALIPIMNALTTGGMMGSLLGFGGLFPEGEYGRARAGEAGAALYLPGAFEGVAHAQSPEEVQSAMDWIAKRFGIGEQISEGGVLRPRTSADIRIEDVGHQYGQLERMSKQQRALLDLVKQGVPGAQEMLQQRRAQALDAALARATEQVIPFSEDRGEGGGAYYDPDRSGGLPHPYGALSDYGEHTAIPWDIFEPAFAPRQAARVAPWLERARRLQEGGA